MRELGEKEKEGMKGTRRNRASQNHKWSIPTMKVRNQGKANKNRASNRGN